MAERKSVFKNILKITGSLFLVYGVIVLIIIGAGYFFNWFYFYGGITLLSLSFLWEKFGRKTKIVLITLLTIVLVIFVLLESLIISFSLKENYQEEKT